MAADGLASQPGARVMLTQVVGYRLDSVLRAKRRLEVYKRTAFACAVYHPVSISSV